MGSTGISQAVDKSRANLLLEADRDFVRRSIMALCLVALMLVLAFGQLAANMIYNISILVSGDREPLPTMAPKIVWLAVLAVALTMSILALLFSAPFIQLWHGFLRLLGRDPEYLWGSYVMAKKQAQKIAYVQAIEPGFRIDKIWLARNKKLPSAVTGSSLLLSQDHNSAIDRSFQKSVKTDPFSGDDDRLKTRTVFALHHEYYHQATDETRFHRLMSVLIIVCAVLAATGAGMLGMKNVSTATTLPAIPASAALFILLAFFFRRWLRQIEVFVEFRADLYALFRTGGHVRRDSPAKGNEDRLMDRSYPRLKPWQAYLDSAGRTGTDQGLQTWLALALCASLAVIMLYSLPFPATSSGLDIVFAMAAAGLLTIAPGAGRAIASQMGEKATGRRFLLILFVVAPLVPFLLLRPVPDLTLLELGFALSLGLFTFGPALRQAFQ